MLTKSYKDGDYCVAGINCYNSKWVRLVSENENYCGAIDEKTLKYYDGTVAEPLDIIELYIKDHYSIKYRFQKENLLIDKNYPIKKIKSVSLNELISFYPPETPNYLFGNNYNSVYSENYLKYIHSSLMFIKVENLKIADKKAYFTYNNNKFKYFSVTDPIYQGENIEMNYAYLVISFPEIPYWKNARYYKFIAKIFP